MLAAVTASRKRRTGTAVKSLRVLDGSSEVTAAPAAMPVVAAANFAPARHKDRVAMFLLQTPRGQASATFWVWLPLLFFKRQRRRFKDVQT